MKPSKTYRMPNNTSKAVESEIYFAGVWRQIKEQERRRARAKPVRLPGGCLLYRFPARLR
jgi:hypothetical protein